MVTAAQWLAIGAGVWLIGLGVFMLAAPRRSLDALAAMGGTGTIHFGELSLRVLIGAALVVAGAGSRFPLAITVLGWFLIVSAVVLMLLPRRWHSAYSTWWSRRIPIAAVRLIAPLSVVGGGLLIWTFV